MRRMMDRQNYWVMVADVWSYQQSALHSATTTAVVCWKSQRAAMTALTKKLRSVDHLRYCCCCCCSTQERMSGVASTWRWEPLVASQAHGSSIDAAMCAYCWDGTVSVFLLPHLKKKRKKRRCVAVLGFVRSGICKIRTPTILLLRSCFALLRSNVQSKM